MTAEKGKPHRSQVITRDPDVLKFIVSTGFPHFGKGEPAQIRFRSFLGKGIFASDGERAKMVSQSSRKEYTVLLYSKATNDPSCTGFLTPMISTAPSPARTSVRRSR